MEQIIIHFDFTDLGAKYVSYQEGLKLIEQGKGFITHCTAFFTTENLNAVVIKDNSTYVSVANLMSDNGYIHIDKHIRPEHNLEKMLKAGAFTFIF